VNVFVQVLVQIALAKPCYMYDVSSEHDVMNFDCIL